MLWHKMRESMRRKSWRIEDWDFSNFRLLGQEENKLNYVLGSITCACSILIFLFLFFFFVLLSIRKAFPFVGFGFNYVVNM